METENNEKYNPLEELSSSAQDYINMRIDEAKLNLSENFAILFNKIIFFFLSVAIGGLAVGFMATAFNSWISIVVDSKTYGALITSGIFIIMLIFLFIFKNRLFTDSMVRIFIRMFFNNYRDGKRGN